MKHNILKFVYVIGLILVGCAKGQSMYGGEKHGSDREMVTRSETDDWGIDITEPGEYENILKDELEFATYEEVLQNNVCKEVYDEVTRSNIQNTKKYTDDDDDDNIDKINENDYPQCWARWDCCSCFFVNRLKERA